jgi:hypothetical protein
MSDEELLELGAALDTAECFSLRGYYALPTSKFVGELGGTWGRTDETPRCCLGSPRS